MNMHRKHPAGMALLLSLSTVAAGFAPASHADDLPAQMTVDGSPWTRQGQGTATYLWFSVYDAALYAPTPLSPSNALEPGTARALLLSYRHAISAADIRQASNQVLQRQLSPAALSALKPALAALESAMQSVQPGDTYTLIWQPPRLSLRFNNRRVFSRDDAALARAYFGIWLGTAPLSDTLKAELLADNPRASTQ